MFCEYPSIENSYRAKFVASLLRDPGFQKDAPWVVTEKIHGANLSFWVEKDGHVSVARRNAIMKSDEVPKFYGAKYALKDHQVACQRLAKQVQALFPNAEAVAIFGELYGGLYPGQKSEPGHVAIQHGICYSTRNEFRVFDVAWREAKAKSDEGAEDKEAKSDEGAEALNFLDYAHTIRLCTAVGLPYCPVQFSGTFDECLAWSETTYSAPTTIPALLGFKEELPGNLREGNVIRPDRTFFLRGGSRANLKHKREAMSDMERGREGKPAPKPKDELNPQDAANYLAYVTPARFESVKSKYGDQPQTFTFWMVKILEDVEKDIIKDGAVVTKAVRKVLSRGIQALLKRVL